MQLVVFPHFRSFSSVNVIARNDLLNKIIPNKFWPYFFSFFHFITIKLEDLIKNTEIFQTDHSFRLHLYSL